MLHSLNVRDYMTRSIMTLRPEQDVVEAAVMLSERRISGAPVVDDLGNLAGILSDTDCIRAMLKLGFDPAWRRPASSIRRLRSQGRSQSQAFSMPSAASPPQLP